MSNAPDKYTDEEADVIVEEEDALDDGTGPNTGGPPGTVVCDFETW